MNLFKLRETIKTGKLEWRKHILIRLAQRNIPQEIIIEVIIHGEVIEDYPHHTPFPTCLILGWIKRKPYHVLVSLDETNNIVYIITGYEPSLEKFEPDYKTRRK